MSATDRSMEMHFTRLKDPTTTGISATSCEPPSWTAEPAALTAHAAARGWRNLRLLSAGDTTFKYDLGSEEADGSQTEWISVFTRGSDGSVRHVYSKGAQMADDRRERGIDLLSPVWQLLDLTPHGRGSWYPPLTY